MSIRNSSKNSKSYFFESEVFSKIKSDFFVPWLFFQLSVGYVSLNLECWSFLYLVYSGLVQETCQGPMEQMIGQAFPNLEVGSIPAQIKIFICFVFSVSLFDLFQGYFPEQVIWFLLMLAVVYDLKECNSWFSGCAHQCDTAQWDSGDDSEVHDGAHPHPGQKGRAHAGGYQAVLCGSREGGVEVRHPLRPLRHSHNHTSCYILQHQEEGIVLLSMFTSSNCRNSFLC